MWLSDFRKQFGLELETLGYYIRQDGAKRNPPLRVSDELLYKLEHLKGFRTVPKLADLIAEVCGATAEQRDQLVLEQYRGTWKPKAGARAQATMAAPAPPLQKPREGRKGLTAAEGRRKPVVCVDRLGDVLARYVSIENAAAVTGLSRDAIADRVSRKITANEFQLCGTTFRFEEEWKAMGPQQRIKDAQRTLNGRSIVGMCRARPVTVVTPKGQVLQYNSVLAAATATGQVAGSVATRCQMNRPMRNGNLGGNLYLYTDKWNAMSAEARAGLVNGRMA
jgi:hypothetical protein